MTATDIGQERAERKWRQQFVSDVFHTLSQPLTALHCSLELALHKKGSIEQQRSALRDALHMTARAIDSARFVRLLAEADEPGDLVVLNLLPVVREVLEEVEPVAASQGLAVHFQWPGDRLDIEADASRFRQAFFLLMDHALKQAGRQELTLVCDVHDNEIRLRVSSGLQTEIGKEAELTDFSERGLLLADRMVRAIGGDIREHRSDAGFYVCMRFPASARTSP